MLINYFTVGLTVENKLLPKHLRCNKSDEDALINRFVSSNGMLQKKPLLLDSFELASEFATFLNNYIPSSTRPYSHSFEVKILNDASTRTKCMVRYKFRDSIMLRKFLYGT